MAGKRANGEGSVAKRPDGTWEARFSYEDPETGRTKRISSYGKSQAEARAKMREKRQRVEAGQPAKDSAIPLAEYATRWIETTLAVSDRKASTKQTYAHLSRRHLQGEGIGAVTLDKLRAMHVEALILAMRDAGSSQSTVRQTYTVLRAILDAAVRDQLVARNVAALVKRPGVDRHEARFLSREEVVALLDASRGTRFAEFLSLLTLTGLRRGEALALRWADVELEGAATIRIRGTLARVGGALTITEPKTERSRRVIALSAPAVALLRAVRERQGRERERASELWEESGLVFTTETGRPVDPRNALRAFAAAAKKAEVEGASIHSLRHSAASAMLGAGVPLKAVSDVLGHSSIAITGDVYGHLSPEVQRSALDTLAGVLA